MVLTTAVGSGLTMSSLLSMALDASFSSVLRHSGNFEVAQSDVQILVFARRYFRHHSYGISTEGRIQCNSDS